MKRIQCPKCGVNVAEAGVTVVVRETKIYMRAPRGEDLVMLGSAGEPRIDDVRCRNCFTELPVRCVETLRLVA